MDMPDGHAPASPMPSVSEYATLADAIRAKLDEAFEPSLLEVVDESHLHAGHRGAAEHAAEHGSAESHFKVVIVSDRFREIPRVARHQAVHQVLAEVMPRIHALSIDAREGDGKKAGGGTEQGNDPVNRDPDTGKSKAWATKDTTKGVAFKKD